MPPARGIDRSVAALRSLHAVVADSGDLDAMVERALDVLSASFAVHGLAIVAASDLDATGRAAHARPATDTWMPAAAGSLSALVEHADTWPARVPAGTDRVDIDGHDVVAVLVGGNVDDAMRVVVAAFGAMLDTDLQRQHVERDLHERVKELEALRVVQVVLESDVGWPEQLGRIAEALVYAMQYPAVARVELRVDDHAVVDGAPGTLLVAATSTIVVDNVARGELHVGYVAPRPLLDPEEPDLVRAVARSLSAHLAAADARAANQSAAMRLRRVLDGLPSAIFEFGHDLCGEVVTLAENFPAERLPAPGVPLTSWHDPIADQAIRAITAGLTGRSSVDEVWWQQRWWQVRVDPQADDVGVVNRVLVSFLDVTDRLARKAAEDKLGLLLHTASLPIIGLDQSGAVTSWNRGATQLLGWRAEEAVGRTINDVALDASEDPGETPAAMGNLAARLAALIETGIDTDRFETDLRNRRGRRIHVALNLSLVRDAAGNAVGALAIFEDLTRQKQIVAALERSEEQFLLMAEAVGDVVYRMTPGLQPRFDFISPSAVTVLGRTPLELMNNPALFIEHAHSADAAAVIAHLRHHDEATFRWRWRHPDGTLRWIEDHRSVVRQGDDVVGVVGVIRDVTVDQRAAEATREALDAARRVAEELRQVDTMKSTFLAAVSHELRTPLTSIVGFAETLSRSVADPEAQTYVERLVANAHRLDQLIDDLLDVDRLTRGQVVPRREPVALHQMIERLVQRIDDVDHQVWVDVQPVTAEVDAVMIERSVANLIRNACRHTPAGCQIWISLRRTADRIVIVVADDGPGVAPADRQRIFEPFEQGERSSVLASPGTGIGLSLVQRFVEVHGGRVTVDGSEQGGARFTIDLPYESPASPD